MPTVSAAIYTTWRVIDLTGAVVSGLTATDFNIDLTKDQATTAETVSVTSVGDGVYVFAFIPLATGTYGLSVQEKGTFANSQQGGFSGREWVVTAAGAAFAPDAANCFCSQSDVERYAGKTFSATSTPSATAVLGFMEEVASDLTAVCQLSGKRITPAGGDAPLTVSGTGVQLEDLLREANAIGACYRVETASYLGMPPNDSGRALYFLGRYVELAGGVIPGSAQTIEGRIPAFIATGVLTTLFAVTHHDVAAPSPALTFSMDTEF